MYSNAQATRGRADYTATCSACHGDALEGVSAPALTGDLFIERWRETGLDTVFGFIRERMPPRRDLAVGPIAESSYIDILTYILQVNGYRSGPSELTPEGLGRVMFVGLDGPRPVPDGSHVSTVGCLSQAPNGGWTLSGATEPLRTPSLPTSTPEQLPASAGIPPGDLTFRLTDLEAVPAFMPDEQSDHRLRVTGYLTRQPNAERISVTSVAVIDPTCR